MERETTCADERAATPSGERRAALLRRAARVRVAIFDADGVLTDGLIRIDDAGVETLAFHVRDGHGLILLKQAGIELAVITARRSEALRHRLARLGVDRLYPGRFDKGAAYAELLAALGAAPEETACVGDDEVDAPLLERAGLAVAVRDAHPRLKQCAHWITARAGGQGAVREVCDLILEAQANRPAQGGVR